MTARLALQVDVDAPVEQTWAAATDWAGQGEWMLGTRVRPTGAGGEGVRGEGVGSEVEAFTGIGPVGFLDRMVVTVWEPPHRCSVLHVGRLVRGPGTFAVEPRGDGRSRLVWSEELELPLGLVGRLGWPLVRPFAVVGIGLSLRRFARWVEAGRPVRRTHRDPVTPTG